MSLEVDALCQKIPALPALISKGELESILLEYKQKQLQDYLDVTTAIMFSIGEKYGAELPLAIDLDALTKAAAEVLGEVNSL